MSQTDSPSKPPDVTFNQPLIVRPPEPQYNFLIPYREWYWLKKKIQSIDNAAELFGNAALSFFSVGVGIAITVPSLGLAQSIGWGSLFTIGYICGALICFAVSGAFYYAHKRFSKRDRTTIQDALEEMDCIEEIYAPKLRENASLRSPNEAGE